MKLRTLILFVGLALTACILTAQEPNEEPSRGPDGGTQVHVEGIKILPVNGKPFSGRDSIEWTHTLEDGTVQTTHLDANLARDAQGRIYRERRTWVPANTSEQSRMDYIILRDPIAHTETICTVATRHCKVTGYRASTSFVPTPAGSLDGGKRFLARESLGPSVIEGLNVTGTRETITINPGVIGNTQPVVTTREFWYSPDLEVNLSVTRKDPRTGTQVIHVVDLARSEPDPAMFKVPSGFVVQDLRASAKAEKTPSTVQP